MYICTDPFSPCYRRSIYVYHIAGASEGVFEGFKSISSNIISNYPKIFLYLFAMFFSFESSQEEFYLL